MPSYRTYPLAPSLKGGGIKSEAIAGGGWFALVGALAGVAVLARPANALGAVVLCLDLNVFKSTAEPAARWR